MVHGLLLWSMVHGLRIMIDGSWFMDNYLWSIAYGSWFMLYGLRPMDLWFIVARCIVSSL